jgi:serine protease Do
MKESSYNSNQSPNSSINNTNQSENNSNQYTGQSYYNNQTSYQGQNPYQGQNQYQSNNYQSNYQSQGQYGNLNQDQGQNSYGSNNQYNKTPDYSFWAEQSQNRGFNNYNSNNNPNNTSWDYNNQNANQNYYYSNSNYNNTSQNNQKPPKKERKSNSSGGRVVKFLVKAVCFGLVAGLSFVGVEKLYLAMNPNAGSKTIIGELSDNYDYEVGYTQSGAIKTVSETAVSNIAKDTLPAIVSINSTSTQTTDWFGQSVDQEVEGSGSGIIVGKDEKELLIATNNHVVEGTKSIIVTFADGSQAEAVIKGTDSVADLAVVTVDITKLKDSTLKAITVAKLGNSDDVQVGEMAIAIGNALGYGQSVTVGYVSAKDREVEVSDGYNSKTMVLLQTDAAINPGNSGGALINMEGEVIGINTVKYASSEVEGMGYAIPITKATPIITELMSREVLSEVEQGYLGISGNDVTEDVAAYYNMPVGVYINEAVEGGAADKAGLKGDDIITKADDIDISSISQLKEYVNSLRVGSKVTITYMRNANGTYEESQVTVTLGKNPSLSSSNQSEN